MSKQNNNGVQRSSEGKLATRIDQCRARAKPVNERPDQAIDRLSTLRDDYILFLPIVEIEAHLRGEHGSFG